MVKQPDLIVQARMGSERLPGKVLFPLADKTILGHIITRLRQAQGAGFLIIATGDGGENDPVEAEAHRFDAEVFRGSTQDVLARFYLAAKTFGSRHILRFCADNPFVDPGLIQQGIAFYENNSFDYIHTDGVPLGLGFEIFSFEVLEEAYRQGWEAHHREHVTPFMRETLLNKGCFDPHLPSPAFPLSSCRLTMDTQEDWELVQRLYGLLYEKNPSFTLEDVLRTLEEDPSLRKINEGIVQRC